MSWFPTKTFTPIENHGSLLVWDGYDVQVANYDAGVWREASTGIKLPDVSHWMPLPEPPRFSK